MNRSRLVLWMTVGWFSVWILLAQLNFPYLTNLSRLGTTLNSGVFYELAMLGALFFLWRLAGVLKGFDPVARILLRWAMIPLVVVAAVPFTLGNWAALAHNIAALVFALLLIVASILLFFKIRGRLLLAMIFLQVIGISGEVICLVIKNGTPSWLWGLFEYIFLVAFVALAFRSLDKFEAIKVKG